MEGFPLEGGVVDRFPLTTRPIPAEAGRWRGGFPRRSFGPSPSRGAVILPPGDTRAESAGARRGPFRRSPGPGRDGAGSRPGDLVPDSFAGSGTTLMAAVSLGRRAMVWTARRRRRRPSSRRRRRGLAFRSSGHRLGEGVVFSLGRFSCLAFKAERTSAGTRWDVGSFLGVGIPPAPEGEALPLGRRGGTYSRGG